MYRHDRHEQPNISQISAQFAPRQDGDTAGAIAGTLVAVLDLGSIPDRLKSDRSRGLRRLFRSAATHWVAAIPWAPAAWVAAILRAAAMPWVAATLAAIPRETAMPLAAAIPWVAFVAGPGRRSGRSALHRDFVREERQIATQEAPSLAHSPPRLTPVYSPRHLLLPFSASAVRNRRSLVPASSGFVSFWGIWRPDPGPKPW